MKVEEDFFINELTKLTFTVGDEIKINDIQYDLESNVLISENGKVYANNPGEIVVTSPYGNFFIVVNEENIILNVNATQLLEIGATTKIETQILPRIKNQNVIFESTDKKILTVNDFGVVTALSKGVARVIVRSSEYENVYNELTFIVLSDDEQYYETIVNNIIKDQDISIDLNDNKKILEGIINYNSSSLVGISSYKIFGTSVYSSIFGSGIIYKMNTFYKDGSCIQNTTSLINSENVKEFEYFVITNRHLVHQYNNINVYLGEEIGEVPATVIEYDDKIDLAVLKFRSRYFFPVCKIGASKESEKGECIVSIGNGQGKQLFKSYTFGIVSSTERYVSTDTDNDGVSDWDSEYIQHDAALNECDSGGAIINMKGEIIGINSSKISSAKYNNMSFAIPINLVMEIVSQLEQGIRPKRATLGVSIVDVSMYHQNTEYYQQVYPNMIISKDIRYGFFVTEVDGNGIAYKAGVKPGDIIIMFNNTELKYSYQVRAELGKFLIGSGEIAEMIVIRNNQRITLYVEF